MKKGKGRGSLYEIKLSESETRTYYGPKGTRYKSLISNMRRIAYAEFDRLRTFPINVIPVYDVDDNLIVKVERPGGPIHY